MRERFRRTALIKYYLKTIEIAMQAKQIHSFEFLPSVNEMLDKIEGGNIKTTIRAEIIRRELERLRRQITTGGIPLTSRSEAVKRVKANVQAQIRVLLETPLQRVVNATGVVLHTGLGRAPLGEHALQYLQNIACGYVNLEIDLERGRRGERLDLVNDYLTLLSGAQQSAVVNNNAAAVLLMLNSVANRREVIVSRGELIEIGGSFRLPDVMKKSGAKMVEIGTTNRTHLADYENAITSRTAAILLAHTSNYRIQGFTTKPAESDIIELAHHHNLPVLLDLGSGALINMESLGLPHETVVADAVARGFDLVSFSGDKLLGGVQAGIVVGKREYVNKLRKNPLMRVVRCDKLILSMLAFILSRYMVESGPPDIQTYRFLTRSRESLRKMANTVLTGLDDVAKRFFRVEILDSVAEAGSGSLPTETIPSVVLRIQCDKISEVKLAALFRQQDPPVVGYIRAGQFFLDLKAVADKELPFIVNALNRVAEAVASKRGK